MIPPRLRGRRKPVGKIIQLHASTDYINLTPEMFSVVIEPLQDLQRTISEEKTNDDIR